MDTRDTTSHSMMHEETFSTVIQPKMGIVLGQGDTASKWFWNNSYL